VEPWVRPHEPSGGTVRSWGTMRTPRNPFGQVTSPLSALAGPAAASAPAVASTALAASSRILFMHLPPSLQAAPGRAAHLPVFPITVHVTHRSRFGAADDHVENRSIFGKPR